MKFASAKSIVTTFAGKSTITKSLIAALTAGALLLAAPAKSDAQVFFRVGFRRPVYVAPAPIVVAPAPYGYWARRDAYIRHEEWLRAHRYGYYR